MTPAAVLDAVAAAGGVVAEEAGRLVYRAPRGALGPAIRAALRDSRDGILAELRQGWQPAPTSTALLDAPPAPPAPRLAAPVPTAALCAWLRGLLLPGKMFVPQPPEVQSRLSRWGDRFPAIRRVLDRGASGHGWQSLDEDADVAKCGSCPRRPARFLWCDAHPRQGDKRTGQCKRKTWPPPASTAPPYCLDLADCLERIGAGTGSAADAARAAAWLPGGWSVALIIYKYVKNRTLAEPLLRELLRLEAELRAAGVPVVFLPRLNAPQREALLATIDNRTNHRPPSRQR